MSFFGTNQSTSSTPAVVKPSGFFSSFGANTSGTTGAFGAPACFGSSGFASTATAAPLTIGGFNTFGNTANANTATSLGGFGNFGTGAVNPSSTSIFGGPNTATSTAQTFGSFGTANAGTSCISLFGSNVTNSTLGLGQQSTGAFGSFGTNIGKGVSSVTPGFGGFGGQTGFMMGQPQQQMPCVNQDDAFAQAIFNVAIYGDERDTIIAKWNYLQALWGDGKLFYSQSALPVNVSLDNNLCRFKAMGYCRLPGKDNKMGWVALNFSKQLSELRAQKLQIVASLNTLLGNRPNLIINVETIKEYEETKSQMIIYVEEKLSMATNGTKRILATELANYFNQPNVKMQLNNLGVFNVLALVVPDEDQLQEYLENTPKGIDPRMWRQAKLDNPDPTKFIPVPMIGFNELKWRIKCQENETDQQALYLATVEKDLIAIKQRHAAMTAKIMEQKRKLAELSHTVLKIIVKQECTRKIGLALSPEEENLSTKLENMQALVSAPTQFKGRLSELLCQMRIQRTQYYFGCGSEYIIDKSCEEEMKDFLSLLQNAMEALTDTVSKDLKALQIIIDGMPELLNS